MDKGAQEIHAAYDRALLDARVSVAEVKAQLAGLKAGPGLAAVQSARKQRAQEALARALQTGGQGGGPQPTS